MLIGRIVGLVVGLLAGVILVIWGNILISGKMNLIKDVYPNWQAGTRITLNIGRESLVIAAGIIVIVADLVIAIAMVAAG